MILDFYDIVIASPDCPNERYRGLRGHVAGKTEGVEDNVAVFFYDLERVCCVDTEWLTPTGETTSEEEWHALYAEKPDE